MDNLIHTTIMILLFCVRNMIDTRTNKQKKKQESMSNAILSCFVLDEKYPEEYLTDTKK